MAEKYKLSLPAQEVDRRLVQAENIDNIRMLYVRADFSEEMDLTDEEKAHNAAIYAELAASLTQETLEKVPLLIFSDIPFVVSPLFNISDEFIILHIDLLEPFFSSDGLPQLHYIQAILGLFPDGTIVPADDSFLILLGGDSGSSVLDTSMSATSTNAVQNKVIKAYVDDQITIAITGVINTAV